MSSRTKASAPVRFPTTFKRSSSLSCADLTLLSRIVTASAAPGPDAVNEYLRTHPAFLERYVTGSSVPRETFQRWSLKRASRQKQTARQQPSNALEVKAGDCARLRRLFSISLQPGGTLDVLEVLYELASKCAQIAQTDKFELRLVDDIGDSKKNGQTTATRWLGVSRADDGTLHVKTLRRYGKKLPLHILQLPGFRNTLIGEVHFYITIGDDVAQLLNFLAIWACAAVQYAKSAKSNGGEDGSDTLTNLQPHSSASSLNEEAGYLRRQRRLNVFLLDVVKSIFQDMITMDTVILKVMNYAQKLVDADRASLFLVDAHTGELFARIFDISQEAENASDPEKNNQVNNKGHKEIRFKIGKGIAGYVAQTGQSLNITNAYEDARFNSEIDTKTGYHTKTILCMPIFLRNSVIGVVQMVNKHEGSFTRDDEDAFETFANYCGLALHHARLYEKIRRSEQKYRVALEVLAYHSVCNRDEFEQMKKIQLAESVPHLELFEFNGNELNELEKPIYAMRMFNTLFRNVYQNPTPLIV